MADFKRAYAAKRKLISREKEDFLFALGNQWSDEDIKTLKDGGMRPFTDNRIQPNIFLLTGLERQNRSDFKAFPVGEEDSVKAEIASALFKDAIKVSGYSYKSSEQFKDGVTCGESHLELYLDYTENILNGKPCWRKIDGNSIFPEPTFREYDFSDARYVYKVTLDLSKDDLLNLYVRDEKKDRHVRKLIENASNGKLDVSTLLGDEEKHQQSRGYKNGKSDTDASEGGFDLVERFYKKMVEVVFLCDKKTGELKQAEDGEKAQAFVDEYKAGIEAEQAQFQQDMMAFQQAQIMAPMASAPVLPENMVEVPGEEQPMAPEAMPMAPMAPQMPPEQPEQRDPERFITIKRSVPEVWVYAHVPGIEEPLADARAWFYPKWKAYQFIPYFARFSTAPLTGDDRHLLVQGIVHGTKGAQEKHNKAEMLMLRHMNSSANSGWLSEEDAWVDRESAKNHGTNAGVNLEYKKGAPKPERIYPMQLSQGHAQIAADSAESIKAQLGINADLLAVQEGSSQSGRAIALRQRQGLLMVQELFDNLTRSRIVAGKFLLTQLGEIYDTETAKKVLGDAFLERNFPPLMLQNPDDPEKPAEPMKDAEGNPMKYDKEMAQVAIAEVLAGDLGQYDVTVGEAVASETMKLANAGEIKDFAAAYPGLIPPDVILEESQLPQATKSKILASIKQAQAAQQTAASAGMGAPNVQA
jgi:hypothetical protein